MGAVCVAVCMMCFSTCCQYQTSFRWRTEGRWHG